MFAYDGRRTILLMDFILLGPHFEQILGYCICLEGGNLSVRLSGCPGVRMSVRPHRGVRESF